MTQKEITDLNNSRQYNTWDQGIFLQPNHIPVDIKEHVVYMRWNNDGYAGGNCWNDNEPEYYQNEEPEFEALNAVCFYLNPHITEQHIKMIKSVSIEDDGGYDREYYGNATNYKVRYILLSKVETLVQALKDLNI